MVTLVIVHDFDLLVIGSGPGGQKAAIAAAKKMAGLKADDKVEQLILPKPRSFLEGLFGGPMVASQVKTYTHNLLDYFQQAETAVRLFREPVVLMAPVHIRVE
jgi:hypothetical protein